MSIAGRIDLENLYDRLAAAQARILALATDLRAKANAEPYGSPAKTEYLAQSLGLLDAMRIVDRTCFVADSDGCVAPLHGLPQEYPHHDLDLNDSLDADWRDQQKARTE